MNVWLKWRPAAYHGQHKSAPFFEGWYFKLIDQTGQHRRAIIPGIFRHKDETESHAFVQTLDGTTGKSHYHRYRVDEFWASEEELDVRVGPNRFRLDGVDLAIDRQDEQVHGALRFEGMVPWPVRLLSPGVMGWYAFVPFMQTYHGVLSFDHHISGALSFDGDRIDFNGGRGYTEKDWGQTFPRAYIWLQTNHFDGAAGTSLSGSVATIPWLGSWFRGFIVGLWHGGSFYRFATYGGARITRLSVTDEHVTWHMDGGERVHGGHDNARYRLDIWAKRSEGGLLSSPELEGMVARIHESLTAEVHVRLRRMGSRTGDIMFEGTGRSAGLEVAGAVEEIAETRALTPVRV